MATAAEEDMVSVSFACQRCLRPIIIDESFDNISIHQMAELQLPIYANEKDDADPEVDITRYDHYVAPCRLTDSINATDFMLVSDVPQNPSISAGLKAQAELFDFLSSNSEIDHPLCEECTDYMLEVMERKLKSAESEWNDYNSYLKTLEGSRDAPDLEKLQKELAELNDEEKELVARLEEVTLEGETLKKSIKTEEEKKKSLEEQERQYWREYTKYRRELMLTEDKNRSLKCQIDYAEHFLEVLKETNVFNITFHIWHSGHFGTINNFRLGRLPSAPVDWPEINAAWGQTALLLCALARKIGLTFTKYKIVPFGNHSHVEVLSENKELPLYGTGGFKFFWDTKFDAAMVAFLECLTQFQQEVEKRDKDFCLPYQMERGKVIDPSTGNSYSIKIQFNSEEQWTKALKFMLTNLKWGLAWVSSQFSSE